MSQVKTIFKYELVSFFTKTLDLVYIDYVVGSYISAMTNISKFKGYNSFNLGTGIETCIKDVLKIIEMTL